MIDLNHNGISDVWEVMYGVNGINPNADNNGDGTTNLQKSIMGVDPRKPNSALRITNIQKFDTIVVVSWPSIKGKWYLLQVSSSLGPTASWSSEGDWIAGTGDTITTTVPVIANANFYRVLVSDQSSSGGGLNDWEAIQLGLNPMNAFSAGKTDVNDAPVSDYDFASSTLAAHNVFTITASAPKANQPDSGQPATTTGQFTISRGGFPQFLGPVTVNLSVGGSAGEGVDYSALPRSISFPSGVTSQTIPVIPLSNPSLQTGVIARMTLLSGSGYTVGSGSTASVVITPSQTPTGTGLTAQYYIGSSSTYSSPINFGGATVNYTYTQASSTTGTASISYAGYSTNNRLYLKFVTGTLASGTFNQVYTVSSTTSTTFNVSISGTNLPLSGSGTCLVNPPIVTRTDSKVDFYWYYGTPNGYTNVNPNNISATWDTYLAPTTSGTYVFQLQAYDKARVFLDKNDGNGLQQIVENGWDTPNTNTFKTSGTYVLTASGSTSGRYKMHVDFVKTTATGTSACMLQWSINNGSFANIPSGNAYVTGSTATTGWVANYYNNPTFSAPATRTGTETAITAINNGNWGTGSPDPSIYPDNFVARWTGQVQPQYSETYYFGTRTDDGVKLWVNGQLLIDKWGSQSATDWVGSIDLIAGVKYDIKMEYLENTGSAEAHLYWYSASQPKQIIPVERLYPSSTAPTNITSADSSVGFVGQGFNYTIAGSNQPNGYIVSGLPQGLAYNSATGVISGTVAKAGDYQIVVTASNALGVGSSVVNLSIRDTGSAITREIWTNIGGVNISDIPIDTPPNITGTLTSLESITDYGDNYGERIRGYITAPTTGNYYFWIAGSDSAELWISNNNDPVNKIRRAYVLPTANPLAPPANGTGSRQWNTQAGQKSNWLALTAGQKYYIEVLHKAGSGSGDNLAVGWLLDTTGTRSTPSGIVPGYVLSRYYDTPDMNSNSGALFAASMLAQGTAISSAVGTATLRLSPDETQAVLNISYSGLSSTKTAWHVHNDPYTDANGVLHPSSIIFDLDTAVAQPDGTLIWNISPVGTLSSADIVELIKEGQAYINIHTVNYPNGEIRGNFVFANGSRTFNAPPSPPSMVDDHSDPKAAARFLIQSTFGPSQADIATVQSLGYSGWLDDQFNKPASHHLPYVLANTSSDPTNAYPSTLTFNSWWQQSVTAPDQLRQRVAFALSEIFVVSDTGPLNNNARALSDFYDTLLDNAFGNFRDILKQVTLTPAMGIYLDMRGNDKGDITLGRHPNENYAREIMQLFSIGLYRMWPDGTLVLDRNRNLVPTYDQNVIMGFASVFTGWNYNQTYGARLPTNWSPSANYIDPMVLVPSHHDQGAKRLLNNVVLPPATGNQLDSTKTEYDTYGLNELDAAIDSIFYHPNVGPFICRQLIQRLVTSNPSREYLYRVVKAFNDDGSGVRGNMKAVLNAILLDYEARSSNMLSIPTYGKQREPLLRITGPARAFPAPAAVSGTYSQNGTSVITITTSAAHRLTTGDTTSLQFLSGTPPPTNGNYVVTVSSSTSFTIGATGLLAGTYTQSGTTITVTASHNLAVGNPFYLKVTSGGAPDGIYNVATVPDSTHLTVFTSGSAQRSGTCLIPRYNGGYVQSGTNITISTAQVHGLSAGDNVFINFTSGTATSGTYTVVSATDSMHFTVVTPVSANQTQSSAYVYPLFAPPVVRSGSMTLLGSTWNIGYSNNDVTQTPLDSPTVFNFYFPDYKFPGILSAAGLTTPEFQLTTDSNVILQSNALSGMILSGANANGLSSFRTGGGAIVLDLSPWMTPSYTSDAGIPALVDALNNLLLAGQLSAGAKNTIVSYVANISNFPYSSPTPTTSQMRDRVRAVVHLIITSPDYTIQK